MRKTISVVDFYKRRALRIWPLYYALVVLGFFVVPAVSGWLYHPSEIKQVQAWQPFFWPALALFIFMLPNLCLQVYPRVSTISHAWSIGVEEQFYLIWPWVMKALGKRPVRLCLIGLAMLTVVPAVIAMAQSYCHEHGIHIPRAMRVLCVFVPKMCGQLQMMLAGAVAAFLYIARGDRLPAFATSSWLRVVLLPLIFLFVGLPLPFRDAVLAVLFAVLVLNLTPVKTGWLTAAPIVYLGTISYGIYMFHPLVLNCFMHLGQTMPFQFFNPLLYLAALPTTVAISMLSYKFFEKPFLNWKGKYTFVRSGTI
jgi:peptidoglycan/LPS O-acetylase OafA/YrhL